MENLLLRKATYSDKEIIWEILQQAILKRKNEGSEQWQQGYPNPEVIVDDITNGYAFVCVNEEQVLAYVALIFEGEPAYDSIDGKWLTESNDFAVIHRLATLQSQAIKGVGTWVLKALELEVESQGVASIRVDTNFDNVGMIRVFEKLNYQYCGEVLLKGSPRRAYEKIIKKAIE